MSSLTSTAQSEKSEHYTYHMVGDLLHNLVRQLSRGERTCTSAFLVKFDDTWLEEALWSPKT